jgi:hypothetical protein
MNAYTATTIARASGFTRRAILLKLAPVPAECQTVRGQRAKAWPLCALPAVMQTALEHAAARANFRNAEALLHHCAAAAAPRPKPPTELAPARRDWHADLLQELGDYFDDANCKRDRSNLSPEDREWIWSHICRHARAGLSLAGDNRQGAAFKISLTEQLAGALPALVRQGAKHPLKALRRDLDRKLRAFQAHGRDGLRDGRRLRSGNFRPDLCPDCIQKLLAVDVKLAGREREAWRLLKTKRLLCEVCDQLHGFDVRRDKSAMPRSIARQITPLAELAQPWIKSEAAGRAAGPHIHRDWSDTQPGDYFVADDVTWNHEIFAYQPDGQPWIARLECVYAADELTSCPLDFNLIAGPYNGRHVVLLRLSVHDKLGLPHLGWKLENGVWRSRLVRDELHAQHRLDIRESEDWLADKYSVNMIRHFQPRNPRAKTLEGDFNTLQQRMRLERGFVGFRQRDEQSDASKDFKRRVLAGKEDPRNELLSLEQWTKRLSVILEDFMHEPRGGRLAGRSPWQVWSEALDRRPLRKLAPEDRWMISTHRRLETVKPHGIEFKIGRDSWGWANERLARYIGQQVWAFYHVDCPSLLTVANYKRTEFFSVAGNRLPANTASKEDLAAANRRIAGFNKLGKIVAGMIHHPVIATITRDDEFATPAPGFGAHVAQAKEEHRAQNHRRHDARAAEQREGARLLRTSLLRAQAEEQAETSVP